MTSSTIHDPATCCASSVCGPDVGPRVPRLASDLDWLKRLQALADRVRTVAA